MLSRSNHTLFCLVTMAYLFGLGGSAAAAPPEPELVSIRALLADPEGWLHREVRVEGYVKEMVSLPTQQNFLWYQIVDLEDNAIWVKRALSADSDRLPRNQRIEVVARVAKNTGRQARGQDVILLESERPPSVGVFGRLSGWVEGNVLLAVLLGVFLLLVLVLLFVLFAPPFRRRRQSAAQPTAPVFAGHLPSAAAGAGAGVGAGVGARTGTGGLAEDLATPIYQGPGIIGDIMTPVYYGHIRVDECNDSALEGKTFDLSFPGNRSEAIVGRGSQADIRIDHQYLSRKHLGIQRQNGNLMVRRLPNAQDVTVDGEHLGEGASVVVHDESTIGLPGLALKVHLS